MQHVYRFKITIEDNEDFVRIIDVPANYTFFQLHTYLFEIIPLEGNELASFYILDKRGNKKKEITLIDMNVNEKEDGIAPLLMEKVKLNQIIDDPHQNMAYVYDFMQMHTFSIELIKTFQIQTNEKIPRLIEKKGDFTLPSPSLKSLYSIQTNDEEEMFESHNMDPDDLEALFSDEEMTNMDDEFMPEDE